jgi:hypothetical protein
MGKQGNIGNKYRREENQKETVIPVYVCRNISVAVHFK